MSSSEYLDRLCKEHICFFENSFNSPVRQIIEACIVKQGGKVEFVSMPFMRHLDQVDNKNDYFNMVIVREPLTHLKLLFSSYYKQGETPKSFKFYRTFFQKVQQCDLSKSEGVAEFASWLKRSDVRTVFNPQIAGIDLRKDVDNAVELLETNCDFIIIEEEIKRFSEWLGCSVAEDGHQSMERETPFSEFNIHNHTELFLSFVDKDQELYEKASEKFFHHIDSGIYGRAYKEIRQQYEGIVDRIEAHKVSGWGFAVGQPPVQIVLHVNGKKVSETVANQFRKALFKNGRHPTGKCGFALELQTTALKPTDKVEILFGEIDMPLKLGKNAKTFFDKQSW